MLSNVTVRGRWRTRWAQPPDVTINAKGMGRVSLLAALLSAAAFTQSSKNLAPYYPTPETIVAKMLQLAELKAGEKMYDLGSGDGRIVIMAAQKFHANAVGVEIDSKMVKQSIEQIRKLGLQSTARVVQGDLLQQNYSSADVLTVYLMPEAMDSKVQPLLDRQLKKGARVVAHDFEFRAWTPEQVEHIADDGEGRSHSIYLYRK